MTEQPLTLTRSLHILRRRWVIVGIIVMLGLLAGAGFAALSPPMYTDNALVVLSNSTRNMTTQALIAASNPVLATAAQSLHPAMSKQTLRGRVHVSSPIAFVLSISAKGETAAQAVNTANAVADSYVSYLNAADNPSGKVSARVLQGAKAASRTSLLSPMLTDGGIGALAGALVAVIAVLAAGRDDRQLRRRDDIADAIGVPVLASVPSLHPTKAQHWTRLLDDYEPGVPDARRLRSALAQLELADTRPAGTGASGSSVTVLSLSSDTRALALGPQLAVFAGSQGIRTALVISGPHDLDPVAELQAACVSPPSSSRSTCLRTGVAGRGSLDWPDAALTVVVAVADSRSPHVADVMTTDVTVLAVSAGAATAEQLARVAAGAAHGRPIAGILLADPDPADPTTGRLPQLGRRTEGPTHVTAER